MCTKLGEDPYEYRKSPDEKFRGKKIHIPDLEARYRSPSQGEGVVILDRG